MRRAISEIQTNAAYRWFLGYSLLDEILHFSTFGKNYSRRFKDSRLFEQIFSRILEEAASCVPILRHGCREYKSVGRVCGKCPYLGQCTNSANHVKVVTRHVWEGFVEKVEDIRHTRA